MNFLQLCQRLRMEAGASGTGPVTVINQTGELQRLVNWINTAWMDIQSMRQDWQWMRTSTAFPTVRSQAIYTPAQCNTTNFGMWDRYTFRNYANPAVSISIASPAVIGLIGHNLSVGDTVSFFTDGSLPTGITSGVIYYVVSVPTADTLTISSTAGGAPIATSGTQSGTHNMSSNNVLLFAGLRSEVFIDYLEYDFWRDRYQFGNLRFTNTRPIEFTITPDKSIGLGPPPATGYTIVGDYYTLPTELVLDTDTPELPTQFHMAIVWRALMYYGTYEGAPDAYQRGEKFFKALLRRLMGDRLAETAFWGPLA